jgi:hypothetical protein
MLFPEFVEREDETVLSLPVKLTAVATILETSIEASPDEREIGGLRIVLALILNLFEIYLCYIVKKIIF